MTPQVIVVANLKGGSSKTTTAAHLAAALHESGLKVLAQADGDVVRVSGPYGVVTAELLNLLLAGGDR